MSNKFQKKTIKFAKKIMPHTMDKAPLAQFRYARRYCRHVLKMNDYKTPELMKKRADEFFTWYTLVCTNWDWKKGSHKRR